MSMEMRKKLYIAAPWTLQSKALEFAQRIRHATDYNWEISSTWIVDHPKSGLHQETAVRDLAQVAMSDVLVKLPSAVWRQRLKFHRGGKFVELGYAIALGITVISVGPVETIFDLHPSVSRMTEEECVEWLKANQ